MFFYHHNKYYFFPILLIIIGVVALLTNLKVLDVSIWRWWPILLVLFGVYILVWQRRKKYLLKGLLWYGVIHRVLKSEKLEKILENEKVQRELKKIGDIVEAVLTEQINKLHKKYTKKEK